MTKEELKAYALAIYDFTGMSVEGSCKYAIECIEQGLTIEEACSRFLNRTQAPSATKAPNRTAPVLADPAPKFAYLNQTVIPVERSDPFPKKRLLPYLEGFVITAAHECPLADADSLSTASEMLQRIFDIHSKNWVPVDVPFGYGFFNPKTQVTQIFSDAFETL